MLAEGGKGRREITDRLHAFSIHLQVLESHNHMIPMHMQD